MRSKSKDARVAQKRLIIILGVLAVIVVVVSFLLSSRAHRSRKSTPKPVKIVSPGTDVMKQQWLVKSQAQLERQTQQIALLKARLKQLSRENLRLQKEMQKKLRVKVTSPTYVRYPQNYTNYPPPPPVSYPSQHSGKSYTSSSFGGNNSFHHSISGWKTKQPQNTFQVTRKQLDNLIAVATPVGFEHKNQTNKHFLNHTGSVINQPNNQTAKPNRTHKHLLIPPGSFVSAFLLTGADVPTMGNGAVGPIPVVFRVMSLAQMPNYFKANIKSCFLLGQATGSLSAERAYIRISTLSCVRKDGSPLIVHVQGYATGADGKAGLRGRVVSKQGSVLARALISGFLQGVGEAFSQTQTTISVSPLGSTNSVAPNANTIVKYGMGTGVSKATEMLAKFYMKMANQMFPVIEINAGRVADVIFLKGVRFNGGEK